MSLLRAIVLVLSIIATTLSLYFPNDVRIFKHYSKRRDVLSMNPSLQGNNWLENKDVKNKDNKIKLDSVTGECQTTVSGVKTNDVIFSLSQSLAFDLEKASKKFSSFIDKSQLRTGDLGMVVLLLLHEASLGDKSKFNAYLSSLPETVQGALGWTDEEQYQFIRSTTRNMVSQFKAINDDISTILNLSTSKSGFKKLFQSVENNLLTAESLKWAFSILKSRSVFINGETMLIPGMDYIHFDPFSDNEAFSEGSFFSPKIIKIKSDRDYLNSNMKVFMSYGLKSSSECVEDHGWCPPLKYADASCCEFSLSIDEATDKFPDDKINVLEQAGVGKEAVFDLDAFITEDEEESEGFDGEMIRFIRLKLIQGTDAFILESCFANTVFDTLALPFSKTNEVQIYEFIISKCSSSLDIINAVATQKDDDEVISKLGGYDKMIQNYEKQCPKIALALLRTQERVALEVSLKKAKKVLSRVMKGGEEGQEYYQERRLNELRLLRPLDDTEIGLADGPEGGERDY